MCNKLRLEIADVEDKAKRGRFRRSTRDKARAYVLPKPPPIVQRYTYTELEAKTSPTGRVYKTPAGRFASITTMLSKTQDESKAKYYSVINIKYLSKIKKEIEKKLYPFNEKNLIK